MVKYTGCGLYFYTPRKSAYKGGTTVGINLAFLQHLIETLCFHLHPLSIL